MTENLILLAQNLVITFIAAIGIVFLLSAIASLTNDFLMKVKNNKRSRK